MDLNPQEALLHEFGAYYNADEPEYFLNEGLVELADESARRMVHILGDRALEVAALMRDMAADPDHPFVETICEYTMYDWVEPGSWDKFQRIAQRISDGITKAISGPGKEADDRLNATQDASSPILLRDDTETK